MHAQIAKETLAIVVFFFFLVIIFERPAVVESDHKPLKDILKGHYHG